MGTKKYLIKLTPYDKFFFGGEQTFGQKINDNDNFETNYLVKSNYFPQQTTLLGLIRHQMLIQAGSSVFENNKIADNTEAIKLIGDSGFNIDKGFPIGKIHSLSPVFICNTIDSITNEFYFPANKEYQKYKKLKDNCSEELHDDPLELREVDKGVFKLVKFDPKFPFDDFLINQKFERLKYEEIFTEHRQVGIRKQYQGGTDEKAYYIQTFYKFNKGTTVKKKDYSFVFIVELEDTVKFENNNIVSFGGEQQTFRLDVFPNFKYDFISLVPDYKASIGFDKIVLVSDAYIENNKIFEDSVFAITETVDFRFLINSTDPKINYYNKPTKSKKFNLLKKGSVFYGEIDKIKMHLENEMFSELGYNIYKPVKKA